MYYKTHLKLNKTKTKTALANHYQVDRATLNKWLKLFCSDIFYDEKLLSKRRKFTNSEVEKIKAILGEQPQSFRKADLVELAETDYKTIRESIDKFPNIYGISKLEYQQLSKFPPKVGQHILRCLS